MAANDETVAAPPIPLLVDVEMAAVMLGVSSRHVRNLINAGLLRSIRLGRCIRIARDELVRLAAEGTAQDA